jgi:Cu2+-exporting ATPase
MPTTPSLRKAKLPAEGAEAQDTPDAGTCAHCGDALAGLKIVKRAVGQRRQAYCCLGCAFIAEQLALARAGAQDRAELDASLAQAIVPQGPPAPASLAHAQIEVGGMVCAACGLLIEHRLKRERGVAAVNVDFGAGRAYVAYDPARISLPTLMQVITATGYRTGRAVDPQRTRRIDLLRVLLAWLMMMQVMMLAVPAYVAAPGDISRDVEQLLRIAQFVLTVPVMLFSAWPILRAAVSQVRAGAVGMDLPIVLGLAVAFVASTWATLRADGPVYFDSITMFVALVLSARWWQARVLAQAQVHVGEVERRARLTAQRLRAWPGSPVVDEVPAEALAAGDHVIVAPGQTVPADGILRAGQSTLSQAWLTGEATPLERGEGAPLLAGSVNLEQPIVMEVTRVGEATSLAALGRLVDDAGRERPRVVEAAQRVARAFLWVVLAVTLATIAGWWWVDAAQALPNAIAVLVATCPCALSLAAPAAIGVAQGRLAKIGVLNTRSAAFESLAEVTVLACDKTGTLTGAEPVLLRVVPLRTVEPEAALAQAAALESLSAHPFARAIVQAAQAQSLAVPAAQDGLAEASAGVEATVRGVRLRLGKPTYALGLVQADPAPVAARLLRRLEREQFAHASVIVLADVAGPIALFAFGEQTRPQARELVADCVSRGIEVMLVSGDRRAPVQRVARDLGIGEAYAHQTPQSKRQLIAGQQRQGRRVAMLGDGMNDAPVIAQADVSIALASGSHLAQARADFIVLRSSLADVRRVLASGRHTMRVVRQNLGWAFVYNAGIIPLAAFGFITPALAAVGMAASSALVVANALRAGRV